jgi:hypothetical protein
MRRLLAPLVALPLLFAAPAAHAGCDPDGECHPTDCYTSQPSVPGAVSALQRGNVGGAVSALQTVHC